MSDEHEMEPIPGLPEELPEGERILWRGAPDWRSLALRAYHLKLAGIYFGLFAAWRFAAGVSDGVAITSVIANVVWLAVPAVVGGGLILLLAWLTAKTTVYTITTRRIVMRFGMALPMVVNLPFRVVSEAGMKLHRDGTADLPLALKGRDRIGYLALWPHARAWRLRNPEPMLRSVPDGRRVAQTLATALAESSGKPAPELAPQEAAEGRKPRRAAAPMGRQAASLS